MANYIVHHTKKKRILARKEVALQRLIDAARPSHELLAAAEKVRLARVRALKVRRSTIAPSGDTDTYVKIDQKIQAAFDTTSVEILLENGIEFVAEDNEHCSG
jgi:hypothetical protein